MSNETATPELLHRLAGLTPQRREAAMRMLGRGSDPTPLTIARRADQTAPVRLSSGQEQVWLTDLMTGEPGSLIDHVAVRLRGPLDVPTLSAAFGDLVNRHEPLRTRLTMSDGVPMQVTDPSVDVDLAVVDLTSATLEQAQAAAATDLAVPFSLPSGPLVRLRLYRISAEDHLMVLAMHHIITDGVSQGVLLLDLETLYLARAGGVSADLPALAVEFADFAGWQREFLQGKRLSNLVDYWTDRLDGARLRLNLPLDRARSARRGGAYLDVTAPQAVADLVAGVSRALSTSQFVVLLAAYRLLLWRHTGQRDTLIGTPVTGRSMPATENMIGYFLNMVVLRGVADPAVAVSELIASEHASAMAAYAHQDLPFEQLVAQLRPAREMGSTPLVQAVFSVEGQPGMPEVYLGARCEEVILTGGWAQYDLMVKVVRDGDGFTARWDFDDAILDVERVGRWAQEYWAIVAAMAERPDRLVRDLPGLGDVVDALPDPTDVEVLAWAGAGTRTEPVGFLQETIASAWAELMGVSPGADDVIFDLGGHSLTIAQLSFRLTEIFDTPVAVADLFEHQTVAAQAALVESLLLRAADTLPPEELAALLDEA